MLNHITKDNHTFPAVLYVYIWYLCHACLCVVCVCCVGMCEVCVLFIHVSMYVCGMCLCVCNLII